MVKGTPGLAARASGRAKGELERARDIRFGAGQSLLVGMFIGWAGMALKLGFNEFIGGDTGYILLMGASVAAAWFGGAIGGVIATVTISILNAVILDLGAPNNQGRDVEQFKELLYIVGGTGVALLVGSGGHPGIASSMRSRKLRRWRRPSRPVTPGSSRCSRHPGRGSGNGMSRRAVSSGPMQSFTNTGWIRAVLPRPFPNSPDRSTRPIATRSRPR